MFKQNIRIQFNNNLKYENGLDYYDDYEYVVKLLINKFIELFDISMKTDVINKYDMFIDNAVNYTGYTGIAIPVFNKFLLIKTGVTSGTDVTYLIFQMGFILSQVAFLSILEMNPVTLDQEQKIIATAMGICAANEFLPEYREDFENDKMGQQPAHYYRALNLAYNNNYSMESIKQEILNYCQNKRNEQQKD